MALVVLSIALVACTQLDEVGGGLDTTPPVVEQPVEEQPSTEQPIEEQPVEETPVDEQPVDETPVEETPIEETPVVDHSQTITLDSELRTKNVSHTVTLDVTNDDTVRITLYMTGNYDNPVTIKTMSIDGQNVDFGSITELPKKASDAYDGVVNFGSIVANAHRVTNYQGIRIKSLSTDAGYLEFNVENVSSITFELVFTTSAADYFEKVVISAK